MAKEIVNRVKNSGIITIDFDDLLVPNIFEIDLKDWLIDDFFLVEKKFRKAINLHSWSKYTDSYVCIFCSNDAIIPQWAYMLISSKISDVTNKVVIGKSNQLYEKIYHDLINKLNINDYENKSVIIKGCSSKKVPITAYHLITSRLKGVAKSIMYGEACSAVPVYKKSK
ncbi:MAG: DUF2480 family protein [Flavobacteriaceae bacterium]|jgi:hypothetical protein|tara:strand:- start:683 stop:1189 length:507 start_codon:yes stop_codon:yes gene_type:complete